ncbi:hypothetical protein [Pandoraea sp.]|uniref:hypothetical protein n=1 Tax=Pandoraea sp. TaxID=1883445 RepID=UPI0025E0E324|nr:hypothetical protein [Pandoraea sp.]
MTAISSTQAPIMLLTEIDANNKMMSTLLAEEASSKPANAAGEFSGRARSK